MRTKMTIHSIAIRKSGAGDPAIQITAKSDDGKYATEWLGAKAPDAVFNVWTNALGSNPLQAVHNGDGWAVLGIEFKAKVVDSDYGLKMEDVCHLDTPEPKTETKPEPVEEAKPEPTADDTDFSDLPTEPKKEGETNEIPF